MYYGTIKNCDIANGLGVRVSLFVSGCTHHCKGCFQPETWDFNYGQPYTENTRESLLRLLKPSYIDGLTLLGGEPMELPHQKALLPLLRDIRESMPDKNIWCYTGYTFETDILHGRAHGEVTDDFLDCLDILVDGEFRESEKNIALSFRGSSNQRIIDVPSSLATGKTVVLDLDRKRQHLQSS